jgi:hypothetical protein
VCSPRSFLWGVWGRAWEARGAHLFGRADLCSLETQLFTQGQALSGCWAHSLHLAAPSSSRRPRAREGKSTATTNAVSSIACGCYQGSLTRIVGAHDWAQPARTNENARMHWRRACTLVVGRFSLKGSLDVAFCWATSAKTATATSATTTLVALDSPAQPLTVTNMTLPVDILLVAILSMP